MEFDSKKYRKSIINSAIFYIHLILISISIWANISDQNILLYGSIFLYILFSIINYYLFYGRIFRSREYLIFTSSVIVMQLVGVVIKLKYSYLVIPYYIIALTMIIYLNLKLITFSAKSLLGGDNINLP
jgi:hypothetical protein